MLFTWSTERAKIVYNKYALNPDNSVTTDVKSYRTGILYIACGPLKFGINSEKIRKSTQNFLHRIYGWSEFKMIDKPDSFYWEFGW